ncbi:probable membrane protein, transporter-related [Hahella chejuensis KCTC 2396]|uniref:Probable membrane protein, transporter-related n=1 Tax=Hahella chejuensis (strain KCTC 2396) TaxID=349521 RepID=Q2SPG0_HAHCH|nr:TRAP transporter large permease subunit [Hahella chejuensis]ABC27464.1 probable membrane protein, transporter-related [Hahella chejuensis KCTC 2396]
MNGSLAYESGVAIGRTKREWFSSFPVCLLLAAVVAFGAASDIHNKILQMGQAIWPGYYELRIEPVAPECNPNPNIESELQRLLAQQQAPADDLGLFEPDPVDPATLRASLLNAKAACVEKFQRYEAAKDRITPGVRAFRAGELFVADVIAFGLTSQRFILVILVLICAATATAGRHHIAMRPMVTVLDHRVSTALQLVANAMLFASSWSFRELGLAHGGESPQRDALHLLWMSGFGALTLMSLWQLIKIPEDAKPGGRFGGALLSVPLYTTMCLISGTYFMMEGHVAGVGIYLDKMMDLSDMFLNVGLYVWIGMMLKETRLASLVFNVFHPWKMPPEMLAFVAIAVAAIPTAYTGASGIFVIAAGSVIYLELRKAGARRQLALAATAISGSLGVVLRPCLLVVIIAYLNREVTTDQLFGWGGKVFVLTLMLFAAFSMTMNRRSPIALAPVRVAAPAMLAALKPLIPYVLAISAVTLVYSWGLGVGLNEFTAPRILPVMMLAILVYERYRTPSAAEKKESNGEVKCASFEKALRSATNETTTHIGALLFLMGLSVSVGGVVERSGLMELFPHSFASVWMVMLMLVAILVVIGMVMDPYGAVILVSATIAKIAYDNGVDPVHFWMVTLVAFELGYLSPPVALNHLLTRQVVGEEEIRLAQMEEGSFYQRHERILMPLLVLGSALSIVAFGPLAYQAWS